LDLSPISSGFCHHVMTRPWVAGEGHGLQIWSVAANILNEQSRPDDKEWSSGLGVWHGAYYISPWKPTCYEILGQAVVNTVMNPQAP